MPDRIPDQDHILRHVNALHHDNGTVQGDAFSWKPKRPGDGCSVNWIERAQGNDRTEQIEDIRRVKRRQWKASHRLAVLNTGEIRRTLATKLAELGLAGEPDVIHDPMEADQVHPLPDDTHALIMAIPHEDSPAAMAVRASLASIVIEATPATPDQQRA